MNLQDSVKWDYLQLCLFSIKKYFNFKVTHTYKPCPIYGAKRFYVVFKEYISVTLISYFYDT